jgi:IS30 family transposase
LIGLNRNRWSVWIGIINRFGPESPIGFTGIRKITEQFENLPNKMCKTITFDQGIEFADYRHLEQQIQCKVYYCETHSPWQKGSNENMNGRLRRYLPRETEIAKIAQSQLDELATKMNRCPRKCLSFKMPNELFIQQYKNDCRTWS